jgi:hypothetical protein
MSRDERVSLKPERETMVELFVPAGKILSLSFSLSLSLSLFLSVFLAFSSSLSPSLSPLSRDWY